MIFTPFSFQNIFSPVTNGLIQYFNNAPSGTTVFDLSAGSGGNGTLVGATLTWNSTYNYWTTSNSNDGYVRLNNLTTGIVNSAFTCEFWLRWITNASDPGIWGNRSGNFGSNFTTLGVNGTTERVSCYWADSGGNEMFIGDIADTKLTKNKFQQIVITSAAISPTTTLQCFIDGELKQKKDTTIRTDSSGRELRMYGGGPNATNRFTNANFGIYRLYNRVLTKEEVLQNYNADKWRYTAIT